MGREMATPEALRNRWGIAAMIGRGKRTDGLPELADVASSPRGGHRCFGGGNDHRPGHHHDNDGAADGGSPNDSDRRHSRCISAHPPGLGGDVDRAGDGVHFHGDELGNRWRAA